MAPKRSQTAPPFPQTATVPPGSSSVGLTPRNCGIHFGEPQYHSTCRPFTLSRHPHGYPLHGLRRAHITSMSWVRTPVTAVCHLPPWLAASQSAPSFSEIRNGLLWTDTREFGMAVSTDICSVFHSGFISLDILHTANGSGPRRQHFRCSRKLPSSSMALLTALAKLTFACGEWQAAASHVAKISARLPRETGCGAT